MTKAVLFAALGAAAAATMAIVAYHQSRLGDYEEGDADANSLCSPLSSTPAVSLRVSDGGKMPVVGTFTLLGAATTSISGSSIERMHNIRLGVERIDGTVLQPGEEFSLLKALEPITEAAGYTYEYVIEGDRTVKAVGGGLCQIATTLFRSVLAAGFPVTERVGHSYMVDRYGPGLDATIYFPHPDLKFINDSSYAAVIEGEVDADSVGFHFFGTYDGRKATTSPARIYDEVPPLPVRYYEDSLLSEGAVRCTERSRAGMTAEVVYLVTYPTGEVREQTFVTRYRPWAGLCYVGASR